MKASMIFNKMEHYIKELQQKIKTEIEKNDGNNFEIVNWKHQDEGGGKTMLLSGGTVFEKAGLNISSLKSQLNPEMASTLNTTLGEFRVCGLSLVFHPYSPMIPTIHMNVRYFEKEDKSWFGGGVDLTPYYPYEEDFVHFHQTVADAVKAVFPEKYKAYKDKCDEYFYLKHRNEMRGIGGTFFDYLNNSEDHLKHFELVSSLGNSFLPSYLSLVDKRKATTYGDEEKNFQLFRRGRYVEFNLLYDRGTLFGLKTGGRIDSILMSLPPVVHYPVEDMIKFEPGSFQAKMNGYYQPKDWLAF